MRAVMAPFERHVFVCINRRPEGHVRGCCAGRGSEDLRDRLKVAAKNAGLKGRVRINAAGCLDACEDGPSVVVYPEGVWYRQVATDDIDDIVREHLVNGRPVERLLRPEDPKP